MIKKEYLKLNDISYFVNCFDGVFFEKVFIFVDIGLFFRRLVFEIVFLFVNNKCNYIFIILFL